MIEEEREDQAHREIERRGDDPRFEGSAGRRGDLVRQERQLLDRDQGHHRQVLDEADELPAERRQDPAQGLRQNHIGEHPPMREADRARRLPLPLLDRLDAGTDDFGHVSGLEDGKANDSREEVGEQVRRPEKDESDGVGEDRRVGTKPIDADGREELARDEEVEDEDEDDRRDVADELDVSPAQELQRQVGAGARQSHDDADQRRQNGPPQSEAQRHGGALKQQVRHPALGRGVVADDEVERLAPIPAVGQHVIHPVGRVGERERDEPEQRGVDGRQSRSRGRGRRQPARSRVRLPVVLARSRKGHFRGCQFVTCSAQLRLVNQKS